MRTARLWPWFLILCSFPLDAAAQQDGDKVVVKSQTALLRSLEDTTGSVTEGAVLVVKNVDGDWFWVIWSNGYQTAKGWINRADVIPYSQALDFFNQELKRNPTAAVYNNRGMIWNEKGEQENAIADYSEAIRLDPKDASAFYNRGQAWSEEQEYGKAIADYSEAIRLDPKDMHAYKHRGGAWKATGQFDKAIADYDKAIRLNPKYAMAYLSRGNVWWAKKEYRKAISDYDEAIRLGLRSFGAEGGRSLTLRKRLS